MNRWAQTITSLRTAADYTQEQLAHAVEVTPRTVSRWETGKTAPVARTIDRIALTFNLSRNTLMDLVAGRLGLDRMPSVRHRPRDTCLADDLAELEHLAVQAAMACGMHAMPFYRNSVHRSVAVGEGANPATSADVAATVAAIRELAPSLETLTSRLNRRFVIYGEELDARNVAVRSLVDKEFAGMPHGLARSAREFRDGLDDGRVGVLLDALDGTANFVSGLPFFCSAVAVFIGRQPTAAAVYLPTENSVRSASIGPGLSQASEWHVGTGTRLALSRRPHSHERLQIATHLSRTNVAAAKRLLPVLDALVADGRYSTHMLNCGQLSMAHVATGTFCCFANPATSVWDVAAGEVLVSAMGGQVTDFAGESLDYGRDAVEVLASESRDVHDIARSTFSALAA